jgi:hypothetical protein
LLLLERDEDRLGRDTARDLDAIDELRYAHRATLQRRADEVAGDLRVPRIARRDARAQHIQALAVLASADLAVEERLISADDIALPS